MQFTVGSLQESEVFIGYTPVGDEPMFGEFLKMSDLGGHSLQGISVLADRGTDPKAFAEFVSQKYSGKKVCIFIPGREFDALGTRHGRGGGWYDRFLSAVPRKWLRVGVLNASQLSSGPLKREAWDQPMDALLVWNKNEWKIIKVEN